MKFIVMTAVAFGLAAPAIAQTSSSTSGAASPAVPAQPATSATPGSQGTAATPAAPAPAQPSDPATILKNEFPAYDKDSNGQLSKEEFSAWLVALKNASAQKTALTPEQENAWLSKSFTDADADKNTTVSLTELTTYLTRSS